MNDLPNQTLYAATAALLAGLGLAAGVLRVAQLNYRLGNGTAFAPHGQ